MVKLTGFGDEIAKELDTQLDVMEELGMSALEIRNADGRGIASYSAEEARELHKRLSGRGFEISAIGSPIGKYSITDDFAPHMESFRRVLDAAIELKTKYIRMFSFYADPADNHRVEVFERLAALKAAAKGSGIILLHENERHIYGDIARRNLDIAEEFCDDSFGLIFDPSNYVQCGEDALDAWRLVKKYVRYLHVKDSVRLPEGVSMHDENPHCLAGDGDAHIREIMADLAADGFSGYMSLEPHLQGAARVPGDAQEKWRAAAKALQNAVTTAGMEWN